MSDLPSDSPSRGGPTAGVLILVFGIAEIAILFVLLVFETPVTAAARRAAETWPGRVALALVGWALISIVMIAVLTLWEKRRGTSEP